MIFHSLSISLALLLGCLLDRLLGEPSRYHPIVIYGRYVSFLEHHLHSSTGALWRGILSWFLAVFPPVLVAWGIQQCLYDHWLYIPIAAFAVYCCIGWRSLVEHGQRVADPLEAGDVDTARHALSMIVSRDVATLDEAGIASAASESMLENGPDAIFAALFWFAILGIPGVVLYRACNTLDAMWGYKNERYLYFGKWAARVDDVLNFIPARLTVVAYMIASADWQSAKIAWRCACTQGRRWKSPNAGPVMAAGAGALGLKLGGVGVYHGVKQDRGELGQGERAAATDIARAIQLVNRAGGVWLVGLLLLALL